MDFEGFTNQHLLYESDCTEIYRALENNAPVILKVNKSDHELERKLYHEYNICGLLSNEYTVQPVKIVNQDIYTILVFQDDNMRSLDAYIPENGLSIDRFLILAYQTVKVVEHIHAHSILHKDINPSNIIVNNALDTVKIIDFQLSTMLKHEQTGLTSVQKLEGSLHYISPEQTGRVNRNIDYRSDYYSLGAAFYQMVTGTVPFNKNDPLELVHSHIAKIPTPPNEIKTTVPDVISSIIMKLLQKNPEERYQSAEGLLADIEECIEQLQQTGTIKTFKPGLKDFSHSIQISQKLYGRSREIQSLINAFETACSGTLVTVFVSGYSGTGKTALVHELHKLMTEKNGTFASGKFSQLQKDTPYLAITQACNQLCRFLLMEPAEVLEQWKEKILTALGSNGKLVTDVVPDLEHIIGIQPPAAEVNPIDAQNRFIIVFKKFIQALCEKFPLVVFLDDMQWADLSSANLVKKVVEDRDIKKLLMIISYRENEVTESHPLMHIKQQIEQSGVSSVEIHLRDLQIEDITALLSDSIKTETGRARQLAELIHKKTGGNAFFTHQFIAMLYTENLLHYSNKKHQWIWDLHKIKQKNITDNVVDMMVQRIAELPKEVSVMLQNAACIGDTFSISLLSGIHGEDNFNTLSAIYPAILNGLITPLNDNYKYTESLSNASFKFLHDRVQQAAYSMKSEEEKARVHLHLARALQKNSIESECLLEAADHYSHCRALITDNLEKYSIAGLFLKAGTKAKKSSAFSAALNYFRNGLDFLPQDPFSGEYGLAFTLYAEAAETAFLSGNYDTMETCIETALKKAVSKKDEAGLRKIQIQSLIARDNRKAGIETALRFLSTLDIQMNYSPSPEEVSKALEDIHNMLRRKSIETFVDLPEMKDENSILAVEIMAVTTSAAFVVSPALMVLLIIKQVELSILYGNLPESSYSYDFYGVVLCGIVGDIENGYSFGKLAVSLLDFIDARRIQTKTIHVFNDLVRPWKEHLQKSLGPLVDNYRSGIELGDIEFAAYSAHIYCCYLFCCGKNLSYAGKETAKYSRAIASINQINTHNWNLIYWQTIKNLTDKKKDYSIIDGKIYNRDLLLPQHKETNDRMALCYYYLNSSILSYLFYDFDSALEHSKQVTPYLDGATGKYTVAQHTFYNSLIMLSVYETLSGPEKKTLLENVENNQKKMRAWAEFSPENFQHKYDLVEAENYRTQNSLEALPLYEKSIAGAKENGFIQEEALAYELGAKFFFSRNMILLGKAYLIKASLLYEKRGALNKVRHIKNEFSQYITDKMALFDSSSTTGDSGLDYLSIVKASQAISEEVRYDKLLGKLVSLAVENAGADKGVLVLLTETGSSIQALQTLEPERLETMMNVPLEESSEVPVLPWR